jgi:hypothetical protein
VFRLVLVDLAQDDKSSRAKVAGHISGEVWRTIPPGYKCFFSVAEVLRESATLAG